MIQQPQCEAQAIGMVRRALDVALSRPDGCISAATDAEVQRALHLMRSARCDRGAIRRAEEISATLFALHEAHRAGRPNLFASKMLRLKRMAAASL